LSNDFNSIKQVLNTLLALISPRDQTAETNAAHIGAESPYASFWDLPISTRKIIISICDQRWFYENDGLNVLHAWKAIDIAQTNNLPRPEWAINAIFSCAADAALLGTAKTPLESTLKNAFAIDGHLINRFNHNLQQLDICEEIQAIKSSDPKRDYKSIYNEIGEKYETSEHTIEGYHTRIRNFAPDKPAPDPFGP
jgi:hypothetical protein